MTEQPKRAADLASRHFRNAALISREIGMHPHGSLEGYRAEMAFRHAIQAGRHFAGIALRGVFVANMSAQTIADLSETKSFRDLNFHSPGVVTLSQTLRAAEAAGRLADAVYNAVAQARAREILDRDRDTPEVPE